jgi:phosphoenolpyruvate carboxylase
LYDKIANETQLQDDNINDKLFAFGFWPGGDRDGNPFVKSDTTLQVAERLQHILLRCYYQDIRKLRRRLSFKGIYERMSVLEGKFSDMLNKPGTAIMPVEELLSELNEIISTLKNDHNGLFATMVESFKNRVRLFRYHFASIDVRQDSRVISRSLDAILDHVPDLLPMGWKSAAEHEQLDYLFKINGDADAAENVDEIIQDTIDSFRVIRKIQAKNGESGAHRYIISNCRGAIDIARVFALARLSGWKENLDLDIIPLFETIDDLHRAHETMAKIYSHPVYKAHLKSRNNQQTVMLGFSDGTKDGGYLSANWHIYKAKENITKLSRKEDIAVIFFDGRGGPPARGGGNTQKFYTSLGSEIENKEIQLTVQGQTISSHYGTVVSAAHNIETLLVAGLENQLINDPKKKLANEERTLLEELAERSQVKYQALKSAKEFMPYLQKMSPMLYYGEANIGSRPSKRGKSTELKFEDLRAIPFVGAWSQIKQNVPGFYGVGTSLQQLEKEGRLKDCKKLYANSAFFRALCENSMQSLAKTYFPITRFMQADQEFGSFWQDLHDEYQLSCKMLLKVSGQKELLATSPTSRESIKLRENLVLPLITIQQFALTKIRELEASANPDAASVYKKLVIRSMFGNINASRNSA